jgi:hypothetical protein
MAAGHRAARDAIKVRRPELPVGLSLAIVDDQVVGDDASDVRFGLHEVDRATFARRPKPSAAVYAAIGGP